MNILSENINKVNSTTILPGEWARFLNQSAWGWSWYGHFTFRDRVPDAVGVRKHVHPESAGKVWDKLIHELNREIFGNRYYKRKTDGVTWARATEYQVRGAVHYHAVIGRVPDRIRRLKYLDRWNELAGFSRIYQYESGKGAAEYLSKSCYAWKRGEIDLGGPLASEQLKSGTPCLW